MCVMCVYVHVCAHACMCACVYMCMYVHAHVCMCVHMHAEAEDNLECHPQKYYQSYLRQGLLLAWNSLFRLKLLPGSPRDFYESPSWTEPSPQPQTTHFIILEKHMLLGKPGSRSLLLSL